MPNNQMPNQETDGYRKSIIILSRMLAIINRVKNNNYLNSKEELNQYLFDNDFVCGNRTIERDLAAIKDHFGIHISFNRKLNRYHINEDADAIDQEKIQKLLKLSQQYSNAGSIIKTTLSKNKHIQYEEQTESNEILTKLQLFLEAIPTEKIIEIHYQAFQQTTIKVEKVIPILVKQSKNRWYLIAQTKPENLLKTYGFERIKKYDIHKPSKTHTESRNIKEIIDKNYGAYLYTDKEPITIKLKIANWRAEYLNTQPLHHSQKIVSFDKEFTIYTLNLIPNPQFLADIAGLTNSCTILEPIELSEELTLLLKKTISLYDNNMKM